MSVWPYASTREHNFLGVRIQALDLPWPSTTTLEANGRKNIGIALDTLANHPNTAPFISKQLIQRFTTSNPSPAYVGRVAAKFEDNGAGVRGDFKAVLKQILLDQEVRAPETEAQAEIGKLREPLLAMAQLNRVLGANDGSGNVWAGSSGCKVYHNVISEMERPFVAATVFNYYRPTFTPPSGSLASRNLVSPEMQITDTVSVQDWSRFLLHALQNDGTGCIGKPRKVNIFSYSEFWAESSEPVMLSDKLLTLFAPGASTADLRPALIRSVSSLPGGTDQERINRIKLGVMMIMLTPEYRIQR